MVLPSQLFNVDNTLGAVFVGFTVSTFTFGILSAQTHTYFDKYPMDKIAYKILVCSIWVLEGLHTCLIGHFFYTFVITNWGNILILVERPLWSITSQIAVGGFTGLVVRLSFTLRVWSFSHHNLWITSIIAFFSVSQFAFAIWYTVTGFSLKSLALAATYRPFVVVGSVALGIGALTDILIAGTLIYYLRKYKTGHSHSDSLVNRLILYAVNTGILTSAISITSLIAYDVMPGNFVYMACYFVLNKLYANSFLATLNTRQHVKGRGTDRKVVTGGDSYLMTDRTREMPQLNSSTYHDAKLDFDVTSQSFQVTVKREVSVKSDFENVSAKRYGVAC